MATEEGGGSTSLSLLGRFGGLVPGGIYFGLFFVVPFGLIVCFSFWVDFDYKVIHHWTLDNYRYFFSVPDYVGTMWATLWVALAATAITLGLAFPFAYWLSRYVPRGLQKLLLVLVIVPFWTSYLLRVYSWLNILGDKGVINSSLTWLGAIDRFDWDQLHAAMDLGASPLRAIHKILIPQIRPGIVAAVIFVFIPILGEYLAPQIVGGTDGVMMGNLIDEFQKEALYARAASISLLIAAFIVLLLVLFRKSLSAREAYGA